MPETPRVKSIRLLSASPNGVGSSTATTLPATTNGAPPALIVAVPGEFGPPNV